MLSLRSHQPLPPGRSGNHMRLPGCARTAFSPCSVGRPLPAQGAISRAAGEPSTAAVALESLQPYQIVQLRDAAKQGRRNIDIKKLCSDTHLERQTVLTVLKDLRSPSGTATDTRLAARLAALERQKLLQKAVRVQTRPEAAERLAASGGTAHGHMSFADRARTGGEYLRKRLSHDAEEMLEKVYQTTRAKYPSEEVLQGLYELYRIPRRRTKQWFDERRGHTIPPARSAEQWHPDHARHSDVEAVSQNPQEWSLTSWTDLD